MWIVSCTVDSSIDIIQIITAEYSILTKVTKVTPYLELCMCGEGKIEMLEHVIFYCKIYVHIQKWYNKPMIVDMEGRDRKGFLQQLVEDRNHFLKTWSSCFVTLPLK